MKIILINDVPKIGKKGSVATVSDGYAINHLIPKKLAVPATAARIKEVEKAEEHQAAENASRTEALKAQVAKLKDTTVTLKAKANKEGSLFQGIHAAEILAVLNKEAGEAFEESHIVLSGPIKETGEHTVEVSLEGIKGSFTLVVEAE